ncbi:DoxX family protein [Sphingobacterium sp. G1-14]|uniref:DoxX family protein n=1 Tax=Sphingobacterium TaxID=28453 RepID=UPI000B491414|nr:DoxX family protein [Sphingobacterium sp. G1-14]
MYNQLFVRIAVSTAFLSAVADRWGLWGAPGASHVSWGNWANFVVYSNTLNFFVPESFGNILAIGATLLEVVLAILLLIGYKLRFTAFVAGMLLISFAIVMTLSLGIKSTFDYSVWVGAAACFLLHTADNFPISIDRYIELRKK